MKIKSILVASLLIISVACKKEENKGATLTTETQPSASNKINLENTLVAKLPEKTLGFYYNDFNSEGFKKAINTSMAKSSSNSFSALMQSEDNQFVKVLNKAGIKIDTLEDVAAILDSYVVFVAEKAVADPKVPVDLGSILKFKDAAKLKSLMAAFKEELKASAKPFEELKIENADAISATLNPNSTPFIAVKDNLAVITMTKEALDKVLNYVNSVPEIVSSETFAKAIGNYSS
ncbi:MAG: hypothetical protein KBC84_06425, partial [Proteobacteria bacterium]|nr:hypothetical protein [Pseudomonadota bacterium]